MSNFDPTALVGGLPGSPAADSRATMQFRPAWFPQQALGMQVEFARLGGLAESLKTQEATLLRKFQELSDGSGLGNSMISLHDGSMDPQRQLARASVQQQLQALRTEQAQVLTAMNAMQQVYSQLRQSVYLVLFSPCQLLYRMAICPAPPRQRCAPPNFLFVSNEFCELGNLVAFSILRDLI